MLKQQHFTDCKKMLEKLEKSPYTTFINDFGIYSIVLVIQFKTKSIDIASEFIQSLASYEGIKIHKPDYLTILKTFINQKKFELDFDDALMLSCMQELDIKKIVTLDKHFRKIPEIEVLAPVEALKLLK